MSNRNERHTSKHLGRKRGKKNANQIKRFSRIQKRLIFSLCIKVLPEKKEKSSPGGQVDAHFVVRLFEGLKCPAGILNLLGE